MGPKQTRLVTLGTQISSFGTKICPYEVIVHRHIDKNEIYPFRLKKKSMLSSKIEDYGILKILPLHWAPFKEQE